MTTEHGYEGDGGGLKLRNQFLHLSPITGMVLFGVAGVLWLVTTQPLSVVGSDFELDAPLTVDQWALLFSSVFGLITLCSGLFAVTVYAYALSVKDRAAQGEVKTKATGGGDPLVPILGAGLQSAASAVAGVGSAYQSLVAYRNLQRALLANLLMVEGAVKSSLSVAQLGEPSLLRPLRRVEEVLNLQRSVAKFLAAAKPAASFDKVDSLLNARQQVLESAHAASRVMYSSELVGTSGLGSLPRLPFETSAFGRLLNEVVLATERVQRSGQRAAIRASLLRLIADVLDDVMEGRTVSVEDERARTLLKHLDPTLGPGEMDALERLFDPEYLMLVLDS